MNAEKCSNEDSVLSSWFYSEGTGILNLDRAKNQVQIQILIKSVSWSKSYDVVTFISRHTRLKENSTNDVDWELLNQIGAQQSYAERCDII